MDSEDLDGDAVFSAGPSNSATPAPTFTQKAETGAGGSLQELKAVGEFMECGECAKKFTVVSEWK